MSTKRTRTDLPITQFSIPLTHTVAETITKDITLTGYTCLPSHQESSGEALNEYFLVGMIISQRYASAIVRFAYKVYREGQNQYISAIENYNITLMNCSDEHIDSIWNEIKASFMLALGHSCQNKNEPKCVLVQLYEQIQDKQD